MKNMVTRKEIARKANVSVSVVSRALNNSGYVDAEKKQRIIQIANEMGYHPNPIATSLQSQRTKQILFFCKDLENAFNIELYEGMIEAAAKRGYMVVINGNLDFDSVRSMMVDGLILTNEHITEVYLNTVGNSYYLPVVTASYGSSVSFQRAVPKIECDLYEGGMKILDYLRQRGHEKIMFVSPYDLPGTDARVRAWRSFVTGKNDGWEEKYFLGVTAKCYGNDKRFSGFPDESWDNFLRLDEPYFARGMLAADLFRERKSDATAVICFNDEMALGFCKRMRHLGVRIPQELSVAGFDGIYARRYSDQMLTTLSLKPKEQGRVCVDVLLDMIQDRKIHYLTKIPLEIIEGETVRSLSRVQAADKTGGNVSCKDRYF